MKKILYFGALMALLLGTTACNEDVLDVMEDGEAPVSFTVNLGDNIDSRAISDGTKANQLWFFVYENGAEITALRQLNVQVVDKKATVTTKLVKGHTYSFVFWAQHAGNTFWGINPAGPTVTMRLGSSRNPIKCSDDDADAFYNVLNDYKVTQSFTEEVTLYRPFAQINILTNDAASVTDFEKYTSSINGWSGDVKFPESMNLLTGETTGSSMGSILENVLPGESLPGYEQYKWICTRYVLAPVDRMVVSNINFSLKYTKNAESNPNVRGITIPNVPIQRNYRTNIIGDFFTEGANFNIEINPMYDGDYEIDQNATYYEANSSGALEDIIAQINNDQPAKAIIKVADGVTLTWQTGASHGSTPLLDETNTKTKQLVFEGEGTATFEAQGAGVGPIRTTNGATIVFNNMTIVDNSVSYAETAWEFGYLEFSGSLKFNNCTFKDAISVEGTTSNNNTDVDAEFVDCKFIGNTETTSANPTPGSLYSVWISGGNSKFTNCEFTGYRGLKMHEAYGSDVTAVYVDGCNFHDLSKKPGLAIGNLDAPTIVSIKNSTFKNCQAGNQGLYIYESDTNVANFNFINENNTVINE